MGPYSMIKRVRPSIRGSASVSASVSVTVSVRESNVALGSALWSG